MNLRIFSKLNPENPSYPIPLTESWQSLSLLDSVKNKEFKIKNGKLSARKDVEGIITYNISFLVELDLIGKHWDSDFYTEMINIGIGIPEENLVQNIFSYFLEYELIRDINGIIISSKNRSPWVSSSLSRNFSLERKNQIPLLICLKKGSEEGPLYIRVASIFVSGFFNKTLING